MLANLIDECEAKTHSCVARAECIDTPTLYECKCSNGYEGNGTANSGGCVLDKRSKMIIIGVTIPVGVALIAGAVAAGAAGTSGAAGAVTVITQSNTS